ncbi:MAG: AAA family ATPase, partial [Candidatus Saccharibacteria bacterium]|nr:AAA family ATPase [Moraxellaceae bacterium]
QTHSISWLIRGYMEAQSLSLMFGDPASGKSFNAVDMAFCIATGRDWHGHKVLAGRVLYIAGEGNRGYSARCKAWSILNGICLNDAPLSFSSKTVNLSDPKAASQLNAEIALITSQTSDAVRLIIVDTVARTMDGDENSSRDMQEFVQQLDALKNQHNCAILMVHHTGHGAKDRARGSTVLKGALDAEYRVSKDQDGLIRLECTKMKESEAPAPMAFKLTDVLLPMLDDEGQPIYKAAIECVEYSEPTRPSSAGLGKNQKIGLSILNELIDVKRDTLQSKGYDTDDARVTVDEWKFKLVAEFQKNTSQKAANSRFYEVKDGLSEKGLIVMEAGNYVHPCSPTVF